jgi:hypothetical protein
MGIQFNKEGIILNNSVFEDIYKVYKKGDIKYLLNRYIDANYWQNELRIFFPNNNIENLTDFSYSTCFNIYINISDISAKTGTQDFNNFIIDNECMYRVQVQISTIASYANVKYIKYEYEGGNIKLVSKSSPFDECQLTISNKVNEFLRKFNLELLSDEILSLEVADISLELREENVTVYNCLFEDEY